MSWYLTKPIRRPPSASSPIYANERSKPAPYLSIAMIRMKPVEIICNHVRSSSAPAEADAVDSLGCR